MAVVRNMPNFTINDVVETDVSLLMKLLDDKKVRSEGAKKQQTVDFTKMTTEEARGQLEGR